MERAARLAHDDTPQTKLGKLDALLAQTSTSMADAVLLAEMLSLLKDRHFPTLELNPQQCRQRILQALISQIEALTLVDRIATLPVLLSVTFRSKFYPPWISQPHVMALTINRLAQRDVGPMIDSGKLHAWVWQELIIRA